jgi:hypothetical protein
MLLMRRLGLYGPPQKRLPHIQRSPPDSTIPSPAKPGQIKLLLKPGPLKLVFPTIDAGLVEPVEFRR